MGKNWQWLYIKTGHKPFGKKISAQSLLNDKTDTILTILSEKEGAAFIKEKCISHGLDWLWIPLPDGNIPSKKFYTPIINVFDELRFRLTENERIYIHCSAGIHRTGMIT